MLVVIAVPVHVKQRPVSHFHHSESLACRSTRLLAATAAAPVHPRTYAAVPLVAAPLPAAAGSAFFE